MCSKGGWNARCVDTLGQRLARWSKYSQYFEALEFEHRTPILNVTYTISELLPYFFEFIRVTRGPFNFNGSYLILQCIFF